MQWINVDLSIDSAWDIILLILTLIALFTSSGFLVSYVRSYITKKTESNRLDTVKIIKSQVDYLEEQIESLNRETKRLFSTNEESRLHKIELMKKNVILIEELKVMKEENHNCALLLADMKKQNSLLRKQNLILEQQLTELRKTKETLQKEIKILEVENQNLKTNEFSKKNIK